jgi:hypothetical protein
MIRARLTGTRMSRRRHERSKARQKLFSVGWLEPARAWVYLWLVGRGVTRSANGDAQSLAALRRRVT